MAAPLVIRFGALGDMILTTPLLRALSERHGCPVDLLTRGAVTPTIFQNLPFVGEVRTIEHRNGPYLFNPDQWSVVRWLRTYRDSPAYLLETNPKSTWLCRKAGIRNLISALDVRRRVNEHTVDFQSRLGSYRSVGHREPFADYKRGTELRISEQERVETDEWMDELGCSGHTYVVFQVGNRKAARSPHQGAHMKEWPDERWIGVMRGVLETLRDARILMNGTENERALLERIARAAGDSRIIPIAGRCTLRRLFAVIERAHSMISVDTGPAHAAAALNCPLVVLFGKTDPRDNCPSSRSSPVLVVTGPADAPVRPGARAWAEFHSMGGIDVAHVLDAWRSGIV